MIDNSQGYYLDLIKASKDAIGFCDLKGTFTDVNGSFELLTHYSRKELLYKKLYQNITPDEYTQLDNKIVEKLLKSNEPVQYEKEFIRKDYIRVPVFLNSFRVNNSRGQPVGFGAIIKDLSAEARDRNEYENKYLTFTESTSEVVCELSRNGRFLYVSRNSKETLFYESWELVGNHIFNYIHQEDILPVRSRFLKAFKSFSNQSCTFRIRGKDGQWHIVDACIKPYTTSRGVLQTILIIRNLTYENSLKSRVQKHEEELRSLKEDLELKKNNLNILYSVTKAVHESVDIEDVYRISLNNLIALDNVDIAFIYIVDNSTGEAVLKAHRNLPEDYITKAGRIPYARGVTWKIIKEGRAVNMEDIQNNPHIGPAGKKLGHHGVLGIPVVIRGSVIGVIFLASYMNRKFNSKEVDLLTSISEHISLAIANANMYRELSKKNRYKSIINTVTTSVHQSVDLNEVLNNAVESIKNNIDNAEKVAIYLLEEGHAVLRACGDYSIKYCEKIPDGDGLTWATIKSGERNFVSELKPDHVVDFTKWESGINSYIGLPIRFNNKVTGVLNIASTSKNAFVENDLGLFDMVARQIEVAFKNAKMVKALESSEKEYRDLFENVPVGIYRTTPNGQIQLANSSFVQMLGFNSFREITEKNLKREDFALNYKKIKKGKSVSNNDELYVFESEWKKVDGSIFYVLESLKTVYDTDGNIRYHESTVKDITERKKAEEGLKESRQRLRDLASHLQSVREEERTKIARELHDDFAQLLTGMMMSLSLLRKELSEQFNTAPNNELLGKVDKTSVLVKDAFRTAKRITGKLRPRILDELGIEAAINWQIAEIKSSSKLDIEFSSKLGEVKPEQERSTAIFRIFQESMTNVLRHSGATSVMIKLYKFKNNILLEVSDNGKGITEEEMYNTKSFGLLGIRERVIPFSGKVSIDGKPGKGTKIKVVIPLKDNNNENTNS